MRATFTGRALGCLVEVVSSSTKPVERLSAFSLKYVFVKAKEGQVGAGGAGEGSS